MTIRAQVFKIFQLGSAIGFTAVVLPILYLIEPFWRIRIGFLVEDRIGHLSTDVEFYLRQQSMDGPRPRTTVLFIVWNPANRQLLEMWRRQLNIVESRWLRRASHGFDAILRRTRFFEAIPVTHPKRHDLIVHEAPVISFTADEGDRGGDLLRKMGVGENDWFVCFHTRDPVYIATREGFGDKPSWQDNNTFRNCSIENYYMAARWIADQGGFAIRMGSAVEKALPDLGPRVIDYATHYRSAFGDVYLPAKCRFFLGGAAGLNNISLIFDVPIALANWSTYYHSGHGPNNIYNPKLLRRANGDLVSFPELKRLGFFDIDGRKESLSILASQLDLEWAENSPEEVLGICQDMVEKLEGIPPAPEAARLQEVYRTFYPEEEAHPLASPIAPRFALKYSQLIQPSSKECTSAPLGRARGSTAEQPRNDGTTL